MPKISASQGAIFTNNDIPSTLIHMNPQLELLHHEVIQTIFQAPNKLKIDSLVIELLETIMPNIADYKPNRFVDRALKRNHLVTIERAKEYLTKNFMRDMSLMELASYSHVSSFHFSRIFIQVQPVLFHQAAQGVLCADRKKDISAE